MKHHGVHPFQRRLIVSGVCLVFLAASTGCARKPQDAAKAAESAVTTSPAPAEPPSELESAHAADEAAPEAAVAPVSPAPAQGPGVEKRRSTSGVGRATKSAPAGAPSMPSSKDLLKEESSDAQPVYAEPPEVAQALLDFDNQLEALSTTRACDEACRALESMKRTAQRICELVLDADPKERCRTARVRLEQASRDLTTRCPSCR